MSSRSLAFMIAMLCLVWPGAAHAQKKEDGVQYAGESLGGSLILGNRNDRKKCAATCEAEGRCDSWTYEFEREDISTVCRLKAGVGPKTKTDKRYMSGLRQSPKPAPRAAPPPPPTEAELAAAKVRALRVPEEVVELHRPRFHLRKLSAAEKAEAHQIGQWTRAGLTWPEFQRLQQLAESGDNQVMELVYDALKDMPINRAFPFEVRDTKIESAPYLALASLWAAHIQAMHGVDSSRYRMPCSSAPRALYGDCGYRMENYSFDRQRADFSFVPVWGDDAFQRQRIDGIFKRMALNVEPSNVEVTWLQKYSETHDLSAEFKSAEAARSALLQSIAETNARQLAAARERSLADWNRLFGKQLDQKDVSNLWWAAQILGGEHLQRYETVYGRGGPPPMPDTNWSAAASAWLNPGEVNVRIVDGDGKHDTTMSSFQAAIIGAKRQ